MTELKTRPTDESVEEFLNNIGDEITRQDCRILAELMKEVTGSEPRMWGESIVGFGSYHYRGRSGREGDWFLVGFSPRKRNLTLYLMSGFERAGELLDRLGKHKTGKGCLYVNRLEDIHMPTLRELVRQSVEQMIQTNA